MGIWVVPFFGQGHILPSIELCKHLALRGLKNFLVIPSNLSSSVPEALRQNPLVGVVEISMGPPAGPDRPPFPGEDDGHLSVDLENILKARVAGPEEDRPICAILDVMMDWTGEIFRKFEVPTVGFFTSGACSTAMQYAAWKAQPVDVRPGEVRLLPGLPDEMGLTYSDTKQGRHGPPGPPDHHDGRTRPGPPPDHHDGCVPPGPPPYHHGGRVHPGSPPPKVRGGPRGMGPPSRLDGQPPWVEGVERAIGLMINTCVDLERPFLEYIACQIGKPVWGVGPLLPEQYWSSIGSVVHDHESRTNRRSNLTEDEVVQWLDSKPRGSVLYVSFGSEVGPTLEEYPELANALEASPDQPFVWALQHGAGRRGPPRPGQGTEQEEFFPHRLQERAGTRGLIIHGWAPQLMILSHPSTGGFLSHCGWNSTAEAIGRGVPFLAWPIRGDQFNNAKMVVSHLKVGFMVSDDLSEKVKKEDIVKGIERLMNDKVVKRRALELAKKFEHGFPASSADSLDAFTDLIRHKQV